MARTHITGPEFSGENTTGNIAAQLTASFGGTVSTSTPGANCPAGIAPGATAGTDLNRGVYNAVFTIARDLAPATAAANNIAASQSPAAGAISLVAASGAGVTVMTGPGGVTVRRLDTPRALRIVSGGNDSGITFTVRGFDEYGVPLTETVTGANAGTATLKKAFLDVVSVSHTGSVAGTVTVGTTDILGFPFRVDKWAFIDVVMNNALISATTGFTAADTNTATATTGDVRGTYTLQTAADGTKTFQLFIFCPHAASPDATLTYGKAQFSA
jgi:hypothetical protein